MRRLAAGFGAILITLASCFGPLTATSFAATSSQPPLPTINGTGQALEIAPPVITLTVSPGQKMTVQLNLRDVSNSDLIVNNQVNDFVASGEDGTPKILLDNSDSNNPYTLKGWLAPIPQFELTPHQIKSVPVTIMVPTDASPGGHYGVVRFTAVPPDLQGTGVSLSASLGALMLLTVSGKITDQLSVSEFSVNKDGHTGSLFQSAPLNFVERLKNSGNVHEAPSGLVTITDMFGKKLATLGVNQPPRNILPASTRKFQQPLDSSVIGSKHLFGHYHAVLSLAYGTSKQSLTSSLSFWVIPYTLIGIIIAILLIGFFGLRFLLRRYNRMIIAKAQGSKPPKPTKK